MTAPWTCFPQVSVTSLELFAMFFRGAAAHRLTLVDLVGGG